MKTTFRRLQCGILAVAWLLAGCNSDVFIDRFLSAEPSVSLSETEKEVTVCFEADNWDILGVESLREGVAVSATDLEGKNSKYLPFEEGETGIVYCRNAFLDFRVEKETAVNCILFPARISMTSRLKHLSGWATVMKRR